MDIPFTFSLRLEVVSAELLKINAYKAPRDKLVVMKNVIQLAVDLIKKCLAGEEGVNQDILLPTIILVILRANPPNLITNIKYVSRFRKAQDLEKGENQFCMTTMVSLIDDRWALYHTCTIYRLLH